MKKLFIAFGMASIFSPAIAQHKHGQEYNKSVFRDRIAKRNNEAIRQTNTTAMQQFPAWAVNVDKSTGALRDIYGPAISLPGATNLERSQYCISQKLSALGINASQWQMYRNTETDKAGWVEYQQVINGHKVAFSKLSFRFTTDGRLVRIKMKNYGQPGTTSAPTVAGTDALTVAAQTLNGATITGSQVEPDWVWFPVPTATGYDLHPSWAYHISGTDLNKEEMQLRGFIDGLTGEVLYTTNDVRFDYNLTVNAPLKAADFNDPVTTELLPNLKLTVNGSTQYTDDLGHFSNTSFNIPDLTTVALEGRWSSVRHVPSSNVVPSEQHNVVALGTTYTYPTTGLAQTRHLTAYYHVNIVHDYMKSHYPTFTGLDVSLPTNVDVSGTCNAFYNGSSINFYTAGTGCNSFAEVRDIVYHEYGHGINGRFYSQFGPSMDNGALNEGYADMWAMCITDDPIVGEYSTIGGGSIRRYDVAPKVFPQDIEGEVHADGEIIAGAWWDVRENINDMSVTADLFAQTLYDTPDGPDGTEGEVYHDVLISALLADDNDANLNNGTPHFLEIVDGFAEHGIYLMSDAEVLHNEIAHQSDNTPITINCTVNITYQPFLKDVQLMYRVRPATSYTAITMTDLGNMQFTADIPAQTGTNLIDYYLAIRDTLEYVNAYGPAGFNANVSTNKSNIPYQFGTLLLGQSYEHFEGTLNGWTVGDFPGIGVYTADNATAGKWVQAVPIQSSTGGQLSQTGADHTSGTGKCLVTGNASNQNQGVGTADVDNGKTTTATPVIDISGFEYPIVEYYRWYSNNRGSNPNSESWEVRIGAPNQLLWPLVESTFVSDQSWRRRIFNIRDYIPTENQVQLLFIANDATNNGGCVVEAAVDDFVIYDRNWPTSVAGSPLEARAKIYPTPADDNINIELSSAQAAKGSISIVDLSGKVISETSMIPGKMQYEIPTSALASGTYFVLIKSEKMVQSQKISVLH